MDKQVEEKFEPAHKPKNGQEINEQPLITPKKKENNQKSNMDAIRDPGIELALIDKGDASSENQDLLEKTDPEAHSV